MSSDIISTTEKEQSDNTSALQNSHLFPRSVQFIMVCLYVWPHRSNEALPRDFLVHNVEVLSMHTNSLHAVDLTQVSLASLGHLD